MYKNVIVVVLDYYGKSVYEFLTRDILISNNCSPESLKSTISVGKLIKLQYEKGLVFIHRYKVIVLIIFN